MHIYSVYDEAFRPYGRVAEGLADKALMHALGQTPMPEESTMYVPQDPALQALPAAEIFRTHAFGGMPVQMGWCNGRNTKLNCLEYHRSSEFNLGTEDFILLVARQQEAVQGKLDTAYVAAFLVPAGVLVEIYATTLHYAPCHVDAARGFRVLVALPAGTNTARPPVQARTPEDALLWACNKWLLAHPDSAEAAQGAYPGLSGKHIDLAREAMQFQGGK